MVLVDAPDAVPVDDFDTAGTKQEKTSCGNQEAFVGSMVAPFILREPSLAVAVELEELELEPVDVIEDVEEPVLEPVDVAEDDTVAVNVLDAAASK